MLKQIEQLLNIESGVLESENGIESFKSAISKLREDSEKVGIERKKDEFFKAGERKTYERISGLLSKNGIDAPKDNLVEFLENDLKEHLQKKDFTESDIKNSAVYQNSIKELQSKLVEFEASKQDAERKLKSYESNFKKEQLLNPILGQFDTSNEPILNLVKQNIINKFDVDENGFALSNGVLLEDEIKNPIKFEDIANKELEKYLQRKKDDASPHSKNKGNGGVELSIFDKLSKFGIEKPKTKNDLYNVIYDSRIDRETRKQLMEKVEDFEDSLPE